MVDEESQLFVAIEAFDRPGDGGTYDQRIAETGNYVASSLADLRRRDDLQIMS